MGEYLEAEAGAFGRKFEKASALSNGRRDSYAKRQNPHMKDISQRELDGLLEAGLPTQCPQARHDLVNLWGDDNVVLGALALNSVMYQEAVDTEISVLYAPTPRLTRASSLPAVCTRAER